MTPRYSPAAAIAAAAIVAIAGALMPGQARADHDGMAARDAYARSTNPKIAAAFVVLDNHRAVACTLIGAGSDAAERVELHTHTEVGGVMKMGKIEGGIEIAPNSTHALARAGDHIMMMGLRQPLASGQSLTLTLDFGPCGTLDVEAPVDNDRAAESAATTGTRLDHGTRGN